MKRFLLTLFLLFVTVPAHAEEPKDIAAQLLQRVEPQYVCMINDRHFPVEQIAVEVGEHTYYGCCPMCKTKLEKSEESRTAVDPVSGVSVDKAIAVIGAAEDGRVFYFENEENMAAFAFPEEEAIPLENMTGDDE